LTRPLSNEAANSNFGAALKPTFKTVGSIRISGDAVIDIMRTHPLVIVGGILQHNPFFVPPGEFLHEIRERRAGQPARPVTAG
jgi:hypothetical protein